MTDYFWHRNRDVDTKISVDEVIELSDWSCGCTSFALYQTKRKCVCFWFALRKLCDKKIEETLKKDVRC